MRDSLFLEGSFCIHVGVVFQKSALLILLQYAKIRMTYQTHVYLLLKRRAKELFTKHFYSAMRLPYS